jgi:hypothetical protein
LPSLNKKKKNLLNLFNSPNEYKLANNSQDIEDNICIRSEMDEDKVIVNENESKVFATANEGGIDLEDQKMEVLDTKTDHGYGYVVLLCLLGGLAYAGEGSVGDWSAVFLVIGKVNLLNYFDSILFCWILIVVS